MSMNHKLRRAADSLPAYPKFDMNGRVMFDGKGGILYVDHFKVIDKIRDNSKGDKRKADRELVDYMKMVRNYDLHIKRDKENERLLMVAAENRKRVGVYALKAAITLLLLGMLIVVVIIIADHV